MFLNYMMQSNSSKAISHIMRLTDDVNKYINEKKPWKLEGDEKYQEPPQQ